MAEKTFDPTPRHLAEMRKKGEVLQSRELTGAITLLVAVSFLASRMSALLGTLTDVMRRAFSGLASVEITPSLVHEGAISTVLAVGKELAVFACVIAVAAVVTGLVQTRGLFTLHRLKPNFSHLNPVSGLKQVFSSRGLFETGKGLLKMAILGLVLYFSLRDVPAQLAMVSELGLRTGVAFVGEGLSRMARQGALLLLLAAAIDYAYQFRQFRKRMKMSREEVTEELKNAEGQPFIRAKIREMQRRWSRQRMMQQLIHADVVVTNPTHMAIALRYDGAKMSAPVVVAKGKGLVAEKIMKRAQELGIPVIQNIPLAHALIHVELDAQIPLDLYQAVAEVLAFVYRVRKKPA